MNKEEIYDNEISPLMDRIIEICQKHKIAMLMSFAIPTEADPDLGCTTALLGKEYESTAAQRKACSVIMDRVGSIEPMMITTTHENGEQTLTMVLG